MAHFRFLCLETALSGCSVCAADNEQLIAEAESEVPNSASDTLHNLAEQVLKNAGWTWQDLQAIAVSIGPGSYTGLRIGLAAAKGYAYALSIPIVTVSTLQAMAWGAKYRQGIIVDRYAPAIDARRNEIFWAIYDASLQTLRPEAPMILDDNARGLFEPALTYCLPGNGARKLADFLQFPNLQPSGVDGLLARDMIALAFNDLIQERTADPAYLEPNYTKGFHYA